MIIKSEDFYQSLKSSFMVENFSFDEISQLHYIDGRLIHGNLKIGDGFNQLHIYTFIKPVNYENSELNVLDVQKTNLFIEKILCYGRSIDGLEAGDAARIFLQGQINEKYLKMQPQLWINLSVSS